MSRWRPHRNTLRHSRPSLNRRGTWLSIRLVSNHRAWLVRAMLAGFVAGLGLWLFFSGEGIRFPAGFDLWSRASAEGYLFCTWNLENLFDDVDDPANHDEEEDWFGRHPDAVREKLDRLVGALRLQNGGRGPDILAVVEVENRRAAAMLFDALNRGVAPADRYTTLIHRDNRSGRRIEPAVLSRLPARDDLTRSFPVERIREVHLTGPEGVPLVVLVSHWTSRTRGGTEARRAFYGDLLYRSATALTASEPAADIVVAGDFNDEPGDPSVVEHLHAVAEIDRVLEASRGGAPLLLLDLTARLDPRRGEGTYYYNGRWEVLDHLVASPGLLDESGWSVRPETLRIERPRSLRYGRDGRPWRFGGPKATSPRGVSDHFAVSVRLRVHSRRQDRG